MTPLTRRRFIATATLVGLGLAAGAIGWRRKQLIEWLARPAVPSAPPGELSAHAADTLLAAARALLDERITAESYTDYFRWRAAHVPGYRALYEAFTADVDRAARAGGARDFAGAEHAHAAAILARLSPRQSWQRMSEGVLRRGELRYSQQIVREIFRIFSRTDAYLRAGYDTWPGVPGGFELLGAPPRGHA